MSLNTATLVWARKNAGLTQAEAATLLEVSRETLNRWEKGEPEVSARKLARFMQLVNLNPADVPEEFKAPAPPDPQISIAAVLPVQKEDKQAGYDGAGYPKRWGRPTLQQFVDDEAMNAYFLRWAEKDKYAEREAYRVSQAAPKPDSEADIRKAARERLVHNPNGTQWPFMSHFVMRGPRTKENIAACYDVLRKLKDEGLLRTATLDNEVVATYPDGDWARLAEEEQKDPGGVLRKAAEEEAGRVRAAERWAQYEADELASAEVVKAEKLRALLEDKAVQAQADEILKARKDQGLT